jgi:hypothetical protein
MEIHNSCLLDGNDYIIEIMDINNGDLTVKGMLLAQNITNINILDKKIGA